MANEIKAKFGASTALSITGMGGLANGSARQTALFDNSSTKWQAVLVYVKLKLGTGPSADKFSEVFIIHDDGDAAPHRSDEAGATAAAIVIKNSRLIGVVHNGNPVASGDVLKSAGFLVDNPGPKFAIAIKNNSGSAFDASDASHWVRVVGVNPEVQ